MDESKKYWVVGMIDGMPPRAELCESRWDKVPGKRNRYERTWLKWKKPEAALSSPWVSSVTLVEAHDKEEAIKIWKQKQN